MKKLLLGALLVWLFIGSSTGCKKFLDAKPDQKLATIATIQDMRAVLDNFNIMNYTDPAIGEACADNYFMTDAVYNARDEYDRNLYTWAPANVFKPQYNAWNNCYTQVNVANTVLQAIADYNGKLDPELTFINAERFSLGQRLFTMH